MENKRYNVQDVRHVRDALPETPESFYDAVERSLAACRSERKERTFAGPRLKKKWLLPLCLALGTAVIYVLGTAWFMLQSGNSLAASLGMCVIPFLPGDAIKIVAATLLAWPVRKAIYR